MMSGSSRLRFLLQIISILSFLTNASSTSQKIKKDNDDTERERGNTHGSAIDETDNTETCSLQNNTDGESVCVSPPALQQQQQQQCNFYLAPSSIPHSGWGAYSTIEIEKGSILNHFPEIVIPIIEITRHAPAGDKYRWLFDSYVWEADVPSAHTESNWTDAFIPGMGAQVNCFSGLNNLNYNYQTIEKTSFGTKRKNSPGAGAFSYYHNMRAKVSKKIEAGSELFQNYGDQWFRDRVKKFGLIPLRHEWRKADSIIEKFYNFIHGEKKKDKKLFSSAFQSDLWDLTKELSTDHQYYERLFNAFPSNVSSVLEAYSLGSAARFKLPDSLRDVEWLRQNGLCMDNIVPRESTIEGAGMGLFATRKLNENSFVAPLPLIQILNISDLDMIFNKSDISDEQINNSNDTDANITSVGKQLLLNYCYSHRYSSILLCPYGAMVNYINHSNKKPNISLRWSNYTGSKYEEMSQKSIDEFPRLKSAGLMLEFWSTREIQEGEELLLDYGEEWENAWNQHVEAFWNNTTTSASSDRDYISALDISPNEPIRTFEEQQTNPYPKNIKVWCIFKDIMNDNHLISSTEKIYSRKWNDKRDSQGALRPCNVTERKEIIVEESIKYYYTATLLNGRDNSIIEDLEGTHIIQDIPQYEGIKGERGGILLVDDYYTSDLFWRGAFRHPIRIPDEIFPQAWMNLKQEVQV